MRVIQQGDTSTPILFFMADSADHISGATGKTVTVQISKNGAAFASPSGSVAEVGLGWYRFTPAAGDVDTFGSLVLNGQAEGCDPTDLEVRIVAFDPYDANALGLGNLDAAISTRSSHSVPDIWNALTSTLTLPNSVGKRLADNIDVPVSSRMSVFTYVAPDNTTINANSTGIEELLNRLTTLRAANLDNLDVTISSRSTLSAAQVNAEVDAALADIRLDQLLSSALDAAPTAGSLFGDLTEDDAGTQRFTANALELGPVSESGETDWTDTEKAQIRHRLGVDGAASAPSAAPSLATQTSITTLSNNLDAVNTSIGAIKAQTDQLTFTDGDVHATLAGETVTVGANNDKSGYSLSAAGVQAIWDALTSALTTAGSIGKFLVDVLDAQISSRMATFVYEAPNNAGITTLLNRLTDTRAANLDGLSALANLDVPVSSRFAEAAYIAPNNDGITALLTRLSTQRAANLDNVDTPVSSRMATFAYIAPDNAGIASLLARLTAARAIALDNLDAAISSRFDGAAYIAPDNAAISAIKAITDALVIVGGRVDASISQAQIDAIRSGLSTLTNADLAALSTLDSNDIANVLTVYGAAKTSDLSGLSTLVESDITDALAAYNVARVSNLSGLSTLTISDIATALSSYNAAKTSDFTTMRLNELLVAPASAPAAGSILSDLLEDDGGAFRFRANALELAPTGSEPHTLDAIAGAVWNALSTTYNTPESMAAALKYVAQRLFTTSVVFTPVDQPSKRLTLYIGQDYTPDSGVLVQWADESTDYTGATAVFQLRKKGMRTAVLEKSIVFTAMNNPAVFYAPIEASDLADLRPGEYEYEVEATLSNGAKVKAVPLSSADLIDEVLPSG